MPRPADRPSGRVHSRAPQATQRPAIGRRRPRGRPASHRPASQGCEEGSGRGAVVDGDRRLAEQQRSFQSPTLDRRKPGDDITASFRRSDNPANEKRVSAPERVETTGSGNRERPQRRRRPATEPSCRSQPQVGLLDRRVVQQVRAGAFLDDLAGLQHVRPVRPGTAPAGRSAPPAGSWCPAG